MGDKKRTTERKRRVEDVYGTPEKIVMMACCPEGEGRVVPRELKDGILLELGKGLGDRGNVVMTRLDDAHLKRIDALVEVEAFRSRSEAAAYFIRQGIHARNDLFAEVMPTVDKIRELKQQAKRELSKKE
jgi:Arc/MetJ-type ribon-helix-helix transcriptional regulator